MADTHSTEQTEAADQKSQTDEGQAKQVPSSVQPAEEWGERLAHGATVASGGKESKPVQRAENK